jgi:hypothetical protein
VKKVLIMPVLAAVLFAAACGEDGGPTTLGPMASARFFDATTGMTGGGGFTTNGQFATGSALASGQSTQSCSTVDAGSTSFGFGAANTGGTGSSGNALATLSNQSITAGGNFTVVATGSATSPTLFLLDDSSSGSLATNQAAVRFVNLAPGAANPFNVLTGTIGGGPTTVTATNIAVGSPTPFNTVTSGSDAFTTLNGHDIVISGTAATLTVQGGTVNTIAIVPNGTSDGFRLVNLPRCS